MSRKNPLSAGGKSTACTTLPQSQKAVETAVESLTAASIEAVRTAQELVEKLAAERAAQKLSKSRVSHVARELREITKVLTRYCTA